MDIHFLRSDEDSINAFVLNAGRVKNIRFEKYYLEIKDTPYYVPIFVPKGTGNFTF
jgi:hypothetical protein